MFARCELESSSALSLHARCRVDAPAAGKRACRQMDRDRLMRLAFGKLSVVLTLRLLLVTVLSSFASAP